MRKRLRSAWASARARITSNAVDLVSGAGILSVSAGAAWIYPPAGLIVLGLLLLAIGVGADR